MTEAEKKAECERLCGDKDKRGIHTIAPVICPIQQDLWRNPKKAQHGL